ncbi:MAG: MotA/TolQ/ExbB proton channel family protein [Gammaproteobacteria bacterium]|nr:MotA/TolQ/ExbB proton channel family protein [Gammaproteobacteria bacterium]
MEIYSFIVAFFRDGGFFLYPMAAVFVAGIAIAIERWVVLTKVRMENRQAWEQITPSLRAGNLTEAMKIAEKSGSALGTVLCYGLSRARATSRRDDVEKAMEESLLEIIPGLDKRTHFLASLANIGMLMGLLGTIVGLISAFGAISTANPADKASLLAASISVAMNNTAGGLIVAITLLMSHMFLEAKTTAVIDSLEVAALKFLNTITERGPGLSPATGAGPAQSPGVARNPAAARGTA